MTVETQAEELRGVRGCNVVCERCRKETVTDPRIIASSNSPSSSRHASPPPSLNKPVGSQGSLQTTHFSNQSMTLTPSTITHTQPSQSDFHTTSQPSEAIITHSQPVTPPSPSSQLPFTNADPQADSGAKPRNEEKLDLEMAHALSHGDRIWCVKFSQDGKFLATGYRNGKAYIYDVQTGTLTW